MTASTLSLSALGQKRTSRSLLRNVCFAPESGHPSIAANVGFVPKPDVNA